MKQSCENTKEEKQMSDENVSMSQEQWDAFHADRARVRGKEVALDFMRSHVLDFEPCVANSQILTAYIQNNNLEWTTENLEAAYEHEKSKLAKPKYREPEPDEAVISADPLSDVPLPTDWDPSIPLNTRRDIHNLDASTYRLFYHSVKSGDKFRARINAILARGL
jgi:hypothetical protein